MVLVPFRVFELVDLDAHGDGLVAGDAARGKTEFGPTLNISAIQRSSAMYSLHFVSRASECRPFSPETFLSTIRYMSSFFLSVFLLLFTRRFVLSPSRQH